MSAFSAKDDPIWLENKVFTGVGKKGSVAKPAHLAKDAFWTGAKAHDASDRILYNKTKGALYYDADGSGHKAAVQIATVKKGLALTSKDFLVI